MSNSVEFGLGPEHLSSPTAFVSSTSSLSRIASAESLRTGVGRTCFPTANEYLFCVTADKVCSFIFSSSATPKTNYGVGHLSPSLGGCEVIRAINDVDSSWGGN